MIAEKKCRAVIMAGADIDDYSFYKGCADDYVICADKGYIHAQNLNVVPDILLGDFDSLEIALPSNIQTVTYPAEKDETDLQIAINHALSKGFSDIYVIGAFGGRTDHFLGNVGLLHWTRERGGNLILEDKDTKMFLLSDSIMLPRKDNFYLSVIPFFADAVVSMSGVKYPVKNVCFKVGDTLGLSNEFSAETAEITVHRGSVIVLECKMDKRNAQN